MSQRGEDVIELSEQGFYVAMHGMDDVFEDAAATGVWPWGGDILHIHLDLCRSLLRLHSMCEYREKD